MSDLLASRGVVPRRRMTAQRGQALVEAALVLPLLLMLAFGVIGVSRVTRAQMGVDAVAREAARAGALAGNPSDALTRATTRAQDVAAGYHLTNGSLRVTVDLGSFARGGDVRAAVQYTVSLGDLPLFGWLQVRVASAHVERIDIYRSRWPPGQGA